MDTTDSFPCTDDESGEAPPLLAFYEDTYDDSGIALGWRTIAWGLLFADGTVVTIPHLDEKAGTTLWRTLQDARMALGGYVDTMNPRTMLASLSQERGRG
jgi:hypothetical protein